MPKVSLSIIKGWFQARMKPTQQQFENTWDSFRHKDDAIALTEVTGLNDALNGKASTVALSAKADLVDGKVPTNQLPESSTASWGGIVGAIEDQEDLTEAFALKCNDEKVGNLESLLTDEKTHIVGAINELDNGISNLSSDQIALSVFKVSNYGTL